MYEEELEVVWDKGSSGLVFYTDASYWDEQEGGIYANRYMSRIVFMLVEYKLKCDFLVKVVSHYVN